MRYCFLESLQRNENLKCFEMNFNPLQKMKSSLNLQLNHTYQLRLPISLSELLSCCGDCSKIKVSQGFCDKKICGAKRKFNNWPIYKIDSCVKWLLVYFLFVPRKKMGQRLCKSQEKLIKKGAWLQISEILNNFSVYSKISHRSILISYQ